MDGRSVRTADPTGETLTGDSGSVIQPHRVVGPPRRLLEGVLVRRDGEPEAAPGMRAADANDIDSRDDAGENAVETTTVHATEDDAATASSEQEHE